MLWRTHGLCEEFSVHGLWIHAYVPLSLQGPGVPCSGCGQMWALETHDDGEGDGLVLVGLCGGRGDGNAGDDGLGVEGGVGEGGHFRRYCYTGVAWERCMGGVVRTRDGILERRIKKRGVDGDKFIKLKITKHCSC